MFSVFRFNAFVGIFSSEHSEIEWCFFIMLIILCASVLASFFQKPIFFIWAIFHLTVWTTILNVNLRFLVYIELYMLWCHYPKFWNFLYDRYTRLSIWFLWTFKWVQFQAARSAYLTYHRKGEGNISIMLGYGNLLCFSRWQIVCPEFLKFGLCELYISTFV